MSNSCNCQNQDCQCQSNSGFVFGLICGAIIGALIAVIIYKNNKTEVFKKLEQKIKTLFKDIIPPSDSSETKPAKKVIAKPPIAQTIIASGSKPEITPIFVKAKKPVPKTFIKPKR